MSENGSVAGQSWKRYLLALGLPYGCVMGVYFSLQSHDWVGGLLSGLLAGLLFAVLMRWFGRKQMRKLRSERPDFGSESVLLEGPANHFAGAEAVGGYLFLTSARLFFKSHKLNLQNHEFNLPLAEIAACEPYRVMGFAPTGLIILSTDSRRERFVVNNRRVWEEAIRTAKQNHPPAASLRNNAMPLVSEA